jgi:hypothetical protein
MPVVSFHRIPLPNNDLGQPQWQEVTVNRSSANQHGRKNGPVNGNSGPRFETTKTTIVNGATGERTSRLESTPVVLRTKTTAPGNRHVYSKMTDKFGNQFSRRAVTEVTRTPVNDLTRPENSHLLNKVNARNDAQLSKWGLIRFISGRQGIYALPGPSPTGGSSRQSPDFLALKAKGIYSHKISDTYLPEQLYVLPDKCNWLRRRFGLNEKYVTAQRASRLNWLRWLLGQDPQMVTSARRERNIARNIHEWQSTHKGWEVQYQRLIKARESSVKHITLPFCHKPLVTGMPIVSPFIPIPSDHIASNRPVVIQGQVVDRLHASRGVKGAAFDPIKEQQFNTMTAANNPQTHWPQTKLKTQIGLPVYDPAKVKVTAHPNPLRYPGYQERPRTVDLSGTEDPILRWLKQHYYAWRNAGFNPAERDAAKDFMDAVTRRAPGLFSAI